MCSWSMSAAICDPAVERSANKLLETLGPRNHFEGPAEIIVFLFEEWSRIDKEMRGFDDRPDDEYYDEVRKRQAEALTLPAADDSIGDSNSILYRPPNFRVSSSA